MIYAIIGGVGSGKSVSATKRMMRSKHHVFCNFNVKSPHCTRLKKSDVIKETVIKTKRDGTPVKRAEINWEFWRKAEKKYKDFHICIDEIHNIAHSRQSMTKWNTLFSMWFSQIRKVLGSDERTHIYLVSQRLARIDVALRDLLHGITYCTKVENPAIQIKTKVWKNGKLVSQILPAIIIHQYHFFGEDCCERYGEFMFMNRKSYTNRTWFMANKYFQYYDTYEMLGESAYL